MPVCHHIFHDLIDGHFLTAMGVPRIAVMAILAPHQAALHKDNKTYPWAIDGPTRFKGMDATNCRHNCLQTANCDSVILLQKPVST